MEDGAVAAALGGVLVGGAFGEPGEQRAGLGELADPIVDVGEVLVDEVGDVSAGGFAGVGYRKHLSDLGEGQPGDLRMADEAETV